MLDIKFIRENPELVQKNATEKGYDIDIKKFLKLDENLRRKQIEIESERAAKNDQARFVAKEGSQDSTIFIKGKQIKEKLAKLEADLAPIEAEWSLLIKEIPNMCWEDVIPGKSEKDNKNLDPAIEPRGFEFEPKTHWQIAQEKKWIDKDRAAKISGARFAYIKGDLVKLQFAIIQFVLDTLTDEEKLKKIIHDNDLKVASKPFTPILPPLMLKTFVYEEMDRLDPRDDRYSIEGEELWLQGSAEHVIGSMHRQEKFDEEELPLRYIGYATSFRKEAGTYGKDSEGIFRMHQFDKLEMEVFSVEETGIEEHKFLIALQENFMQQLNIPYRLVEKCKADIGKPNARGIDIEAWLPGQDKYRETHTADYMTNYQARRLKTRVRRSVDHDFEMQFVHTNDATAFALGRTMIAIIENFQTAEGDVLIPEALQKYMNGEEKI